MPKPYQVQDKYFLMAKERGYRARSAFKLLEIQKKFKVLRRGDTVVDLGAAPGSFMQVIEEIVGAKGFVFGVDLQEIEGFDEANVRCMQADIFDQERVIAGLAAAGILVGAEGRAGGAEGRAVDVVTSDLAPKTSGIKDVDQGLSVELTDQAFYLSTQMLKQGGNFVGKVFEGEDLQWLLRRIKKKFKKVKVFKPESCRDRSFERYIVALGLK